MARDTHKQRLTITDLARRSGISARTIRFWSDEGLIPVAARSAAMYRLYDAQALVRLDLVRTLRELGLGLPAITAILKQQSSLSEVAAVHVAALDTRIRDLRRERAVLRVVVRRGSDTQETQLMQQLMQTSAVERQRIIDEFVTQTFDGVAPDAPGAHIAQAMRCMPADLPDDPSDEQAEAWVELAALVRDPAFSARVREMALAGASSAPGAKLAVDMAHVREHGAAALSGGVDPTSAQADALLARVVPSTLSQAERKTLRQQLETFNDVRVERYWQLMGVLNGRPPFPPTAAACDWVINALRARE
ncbi:MAG: MerR family transcriptional regulator [Polyangiales bacterium]